MELLPDLPEHLAAAALNLREARLQHVRLLGALKESAAIANPLFGFEQQIGNRVTISCVKNRSSATRNRRSRSMFFSYFAR